MISPSASIDEKLRGTRLGLASSFLTIYTIHGTLSRDKFEVVVVVAMGDKHYVGTV